MQGGTEDQTDDGDKLPTPWECVFSSLCDYLSPDMAEKVASVVCTDLNAVMRSIPREDCYTGVVIGACHDDAPEPLQWRGSVDMMEAWY